MIELNQASLKLNAQELPKIVQPLLRWIFSRRKKSCKSLSCSKSTEWTEILNFVLEVIATIFSRIHTLYSFTSSLDTRSKWLVHLLNVWLRHSVFKWSFSFLQQYFSRFPRLRWEASLGLIKFKFIFSLKQCLRQLGHCAPLPLMTTFLKNIQQVKQSKKLLRPF